MTTTDEASHEITFIPPGKLRCVVTDTLRNDKPEENVRQRVARSLIDDYGYNRDDIEVEFRINVGTKRPRIDLAIFPPNTEHSQEHISIIVECKREEFKATDRDNGVGQMKSYMAASLNCRFGMWVGSELQIWERIDTDQGEQDFLLATEIPRFGSQLPRAPHFSDLVRAEAQLVSVFKRCHNYIYGNQGLQKEPAFNEFLKIIFCKVQDENTLADELRFFISNEERRSDLGQRRLKNAMDELFSEVKGRYRYIFEPGSGIRLNNQVMSYVVGELQRYSLIQTRADVKGVAYEQLVGANLRGDRGEFFTPRTVCKMAAEMILATFPEDRWLNINVLDPAVGTGGFLVVLMNVWEEHIRNLERSRWFEDDARVETETVNRLRETASNRLSGIDFNPGLVRAAQMNLVMQGDGSTNVFHANSLLPPGEWPFEASNDVQSNIRLNHFDAILTNPPFGSQIPIDDPHILEQFELARFGTSDGQRRTSMPPEQLFIERCLQLLRPGGRMAIVLPDSILSNPGLLFIRRWLLKKARVVASIDLPTETFEPHTGTQTSVLILQKKTADEIGFENEFGQQREYEVFMAMPRAVGHDRRGNVLHLRTPEGDLIEYEESTPVFRRASDGSTVVENQTRRHVAVHDELPNVVRSFREWVEQPGHRQWFGD